MYFFFWPNQARSIVFEKKMPETIKILIFGGSWGGDGGGAHNIPYNFNITVDFPSIYYIPPPPKKKVGEGASSS